MAQSPEQNSSPKSMPTTKSAGPQQDSLFLQVLLNFVIPIVILIYLKKDSFLGQFFDGWLEDSKSFNKLALILALAFPIGYGCKDFLSRHKINFFSVIGTVNIALTGGMGLFEFPPEQIAIKEAAIPLLMGLAVLISIKTPFPLVKSIIFNEQIINVAKIEIELAKKQARAAFEKTLVVSTLIIAGSFLLAATTNYFLAIILLKSPPGTEQFNDEMAKMIALSYPVNVLPATVVTLIAFFYTLHNIKKFTGLGLEEVMHGVADEDKSESENNQEEK